MATFSFPPHPTCHDAHTNKEADVQSPTWQLHTNRCVILVSCLKKLGWFLWLRTKKSTREQFASGTTRTMCCKWPCGFRARLWVQGSTLLFTMSCSAPRAACGAATMKWMFSSGNAQYSPRMSLCASDLSLLSMHTTSCEGWSDNPISSYVMMARLKSLFAKELYV